MSQNEPDLEAELGVGRPTPVALEPLPPFASVPAHVRVEADIAAKNDAIQAAVDATKAQAAEAHDKVVADRAAAAAQADFSQTPPVAVAVSTPAPCGAEIEAEDAAVEKAPDEVAELRVRLTVLERHFEDVVGHLAQSFGDVYAAKKAQISGLKK